MSNRLQIILEAVTGEFDRGFARASDTLGRFSQRTHDLHRRMDGFARRHRAGFDALQTAGLAATAGLGAMAYGIKGAVDEAMKFESAMADIKKVVDFDSPEGLVKMKADLIALSGELPIAFDGLAQIAAAAGQAGIAAGEIVAFTEAAAKMGVAFDISADEAGQAMAEMRIAFKMNQSEVETLADKINYLGNTTPNAAAGIMNVVQRVGSLGQVAGVSADTIAAMAASLVGVAPEVAATGLKNMFMALSKGEGATKKTAKAFQSLGLDVKKTTDKMQTDSVGAIMEIIHSIKQLPKEAQAAKIQEIFGMEALPVIAQMVDNTEFLEENLRKVGDASLYAGSMAGEYEARAGTLQNSMQILANKTQNAKAAIGEAFAPAVAKLTEVLAPIIDSIQKWASQNPKLVTAIAVVTAGVLGLVAGLGLLATAFLAVSGGISAIAGVASLAGTAIGALSAPIVLAVAALGALAYAGFKLYQNWDMLKAKAVEVFHNLPAPVKEMASNIKSVYDGLVAMTSALFGVIVPLFKGQFELIKTVVATAFGVVKTVFGANFEAIKAVVKTALSVLVTLFNTNFNVIKNVLTTAFTVIKALIRGDMEGVKQALAQGLQNAVGAVKGGVANILGAFKNLGADLKSIGASAVKGLVVGIKEGLVGAATAAREMASTVIQSAKSALGINSPAKKMIPLGKGVVKGLTKGMAKEQKKAANKAKKIAEDVIKSAQEVIDNNKRALALFGKDELFALNYDIDMGKYKGVSQGKLNEMRQSVIALQAQKAQHDKLTEALKREEDITKRTADIKQSILDIQKQMANLNAVDSLQWDIAHDDKYKDISQSVLDDYVAIVAAQEQQKALEADIAKQSEARQSVTQKVLGDMYELNKQIALYNNQSPLASFDYDHANGVFGGADPADIAIKRQALATYAFMQSQTTEQAGFGQLQNELEQKLAIIKDYEDTHTNIEQEAQQARFNALQAYTEAKNNLLLTQYESVFGGLTSIAKDGLGEQSKVYRAMFALQKGFAIAQSALAIQQAISKGLAKGFPAGLPDMALAVSEGAKIVSAIKSVVMPVGQAHDGIMSVPTSGTWNLQKGERVLPRHTAKALDERLDSLGGNQVVNVNVTVNGTAGDVQADEQMGRRFGEAIKMAVQSELLKERKQGGLLYGR